MGRIVATIERGAHLISLCLAPITTELGITQGEAHVLAKLAVQGHSTVGTLHREFGHRRSTLTNIVNRLEDRGFARRELNVRDRRSVVVHLTPAGRRAARSVTKALDRLESALWAHVAARDVAGLHAVVSGLAQAADMASPRRHPRATHGRKH